MDDIVTRHFTKHSADTVWATPDGGNSASDPASEEGFWLDMYHGEVNRNAELEAEIERLRAAGDDLAYWLRAETVNGSMAVCEGTNEALDAWEARRG